jgi:hypothetical protein
MYRLFFFNSFPRSEDMMVVTGTVDEFRNFCEGMKMVFGKDTKLVEVIQIFKNIPQILYQFSKTYNVQIQIEGGCTNVMYDMDVELIGVNIHTHVDVDGNCFCLDCYDPNKVYSYKNFHPKEGIKTEGRKEICSGCGKQLTTVVAKDTHLNLI